MTRYRRRVLVATTAALLTAAGGCTGTNEAANDDATKPATITFWHGWSQPHEVKAIDAQLKQFHDAHPNITVKAVGNVDDDKLTQGIRSGNGPDVVSSFTTDNV